MVDMQLDTQPLMDMASVTWDMGDMEDIMVKMKCKIKWPDAQLYQAL